MLINIGTFINRIDKRNIVNKVDKVLGLNINKDFMPTVANIQNVDISKYKLVEPDTFVFSGMQTGRDNTIRIGLNDTLETFVVSPAYTTFVVNEDIILPKYFYMIFLSSERDRLGSFLSDSSVRANLDWDRFCEIEFEIPSLEIQQKYVDVYNALVANQKAYESGLDDLKLAMDLTVESFKTKKMTLIGKFIEEVKHTNEDLNLNYNSVKGVSKNKEIITTKAKSKTNDISKFIVIKKNDFIYNPRSANAIALNTKFKEALISWNNTAFRIGNQYLGELEPQYLNIWFSREEYSRWALYNSWGSSTEVLPFEEIKNYTIHIPQIVSQKSLIKMFEIYEIRKDINEKLKQQIKEICPVLIKGAIQESKGVI